MGFIRIALNLYRYSAFDWAQDRQRNRARWDRKVLYIYVYIYYHLIVGMVNKMGSTFAIHVFIKETVLQDTGAAEAKILRNFLTSAIQ